MNRDPIPPPHRRHLIRCAIQRLVIFMQVFLLPLLPTLAQSTVRSVKQGRVVFEHLGEVAGINRYTSGIFEDHLGYLWVGAGPEGLYRYDGYVFRHYEFIPDDTTSIPHNITGHIRLEDHRGNLWLHSGGQFCRYNRTTDDFSRFSNAMDALGSDTWGNTLFIAEDGEGMTWLGSPGNPRNPHSGGLLRIEAGGSSFEQLQHDPADTTSLAGNTVTALFADSRGDLWIGTHHSGIDRYIPGTDGQKGTFIHYRGRLMDREDSIRTAVFHISEDDRGTIWAGGGNGILKFNRELDLFERLMMDPDPRSPRNAVTCLPMSPGDQLCVGTAGGLALFDEDRNGFTFFAHDPADPASISPGRVTSIDQGKYGFVWITTNDGYGIAGINRFDPLAGQFHLFCHDPDNGGSLSSNLITDVLVDRNGTLWISTEVGGINKYDPHRLKFHSLGDIILEGEVQWPGKVLSLWLDKRDRLWIGTNGFGLCCYDRKSGETFHYPFAADDPEKGPRSARIWDIVEQPEGILWIGGDSGLNRLDTRTMEFEHFWVDPEWNHSLGPNYIRQLSARTPEMIWLATMGGGLYSFEVKSGRFRSHLKSESEPGGVPPDRLMGVTEDQDGTVWVGSLGGLHGFMPAHGDIPDSCAHYWHIQGDDSSIGSNMVGDILIGKGGILWATTGGGGLNRIDPVTGHVTRFTRKEGLLSNTTTAIAMDDREQLWIGSYSGLGMFDPETGTCVNFDRSDGLPSMEITQGSGFRSDEGEIFFAGPEDIFYFHPDSIPYNSYVPPVVVTGVSIFDNPLPGSAAERLELNHRENFLTFEFSALNFTNSHKNQYKYRMIGIDPDTVVAGTRRTASYTGMKPGRYTFWVTGSNNDGVWNPAGTSLEIIIHPPWSRSDLAIGLYVLLFILGVLGIIRWRTWKLLKDRRTLEKLVMERTRVIEEKDRHILEMDRMKTRFFANISHEFRTPLTLILAPLEEIMSRKPAGDPEIRKLGIMRRNGKRLMNLVNQLLDLSKLDSGKLKLELVHGDVARHLKLICASFLSLADKNRIRYSYHVTEKEWITWFDVGKLETILNNLLSNAFKYTPREGIIECYIRIEEVFVPAGKKEGPVQLTISVIDSGPGIGKEDLRHIFDRFYQGEETNHMESGGTGIGLSLTRELVELVHGEITVNSEPGEGSCFIVKIPLGKDHLRESEYVISVKAPSATAGTDLDFPDPELPPEELPLPPKGPVHLLVVEDNHDLRTYLREQLQGEYALAEAAAGEEGLKKALQIIPDLVLTDVMMPGMDGIELCKRLKNNEKTSHIPVIMLTAKADFDSRIAGLETGADDYILKPFQLKELKTRVHNLIRQRNLLRERFSGNLQLMKEEFNINSYDLKFIRRVTGVVEDHLSDLDFDVKQLQSKAGMSPTQLYRKIHALTGRSPSRFIRFLRLKKAAKLLEQQTLNVTQIALEVGFGNLSYFTKCFREEYGMSPSEYSRQHA